MDDKLNSIVEKLVTVSEKVSKMENIVTEKVANMEARVPSEPSQKSFNKHSQGSKGRQTPNSN